MERDGVPRLTLLLSRSTVHSSIEPYGLNMTRTSFSLIFFDSMPTNSLRSEEGTHDFRDGTKTKLVVRHSRTVPVLRVGGLHLNRMVHL